MAKVLIVDDDPSFIEFVKLCLINEHDIETAADGKKALALVKKQVFDVVLTDILMPEKDGLEVIQDLNSLSPQTATIAMSAGIPGMPMCILKAAKVMGATKTLTKPFSKDQLLKMIAQVL